LQSVGSSVHFVLHSNFVKYVEAVMCSVRVSDLAFFQSLTGLAWANSGEVHVILVTLGC